MVWGNEAKNVGGTGRILINYQAIRDIVAAVIYIVFLGGQMCLWSVWQKRGRKKPGDVEEARSRSAVPCSGRRRYETMAKNDANPPMPSFPGGYVLQEVETDYLAKAVKPKQFLHIDQSECIMCEGCVDICPWKCIHMLSTDTISEALNTGAPATTPTTTWCSSSTRTSAPGAACASTAAPPA